jgi:hypothetical protein
MPDHRHKQENKEDARKGQLSEKGKTQESKAGKVALEEETRKAAQDLGKQASQSTESATKEVQSNHQKLTSYAEREGALKKASEQERKDVGGAL